MLLESNEEWVRSSVNGTLAIRRDINRIVDEICAQEYRNICWLGIGGTWASGMQAAVHMKKQSEIGTWMENTSEYNTAGNKRVGGGAVVITSSIIGSIVEVVETMKHTQAAEAGVIEFIDIDTAELAELVGYKIAYPVSEQSKLFMVVDRLMQNNGEFPDCNAMYVEFKTHLAQALVNAEKKADTFGQEFAKKHWNNLIRYLVEAGNQWGVTCFYAVYCWEGRLWIKAKSIASGEFFHGMLEITTEETPITVFIEEGAQRPLSERVAKPLSRICENYTVIDTKDYGLMRISEGYRKHISHLVAHAVDNRIDTYMEKETRHSMNIRRCYRRLDYQL